MPLSTPHMSDPGSEPSQDACQRCKKRTQGLKIRFWQRIGTVQQGKGAVVSSILGGAPAKMETYSVPGTMPHTCTISSWGTETPGQEGREIQPGLSLLHGNTSARWPLQTFRKKLPMDSAAQPHILNMVPYQYFHSPQWQQLQASINVSFLKCEKLPTIHFEVASSDLLSQT